MDIPCADGVGATVTKVYSALSASTGSVRPARTPGTNAARAPAISSAEAATARLSGWVG